MKKYLLAQLMLPLHTYFLHKVIPLYGSIWICIRQVMHQHPSIVHFKKVSLFLGLNALLIFSSFSQTDFQLNGAAKSIGTECFELTPEQTNKYGSIWYKQKVDLTADFNMNSNMYFGTKDAAGADGIVFAFQGVCTNAGSTGQGLGIAGIKPSLFVEFDTYQNTGAINDPVYDHISIFRDGINSHGSAQNLSSTVQASSTATNIEDGAYHNVKIIWTAASKTLAVYFDNVLRTSYTGDVVSTIFGGNQFVYYGFTAATGGSNNFQRVCLVNPPKQNNAVICNGSSTQLSVVGAGTGTYSWSPSTGLNQSTGTTVTANPVTTTTYTVTGTGGACGAVTFNVTVTVVPIPTPSLSSNSAVCEGSSKTYTTPLHAGSTYVWTVTGAASYTSSSNSVTVVAGSTNYTVNVVETEGVKGCSNIPETGVSSSTIIVHPKPNITAAGGIYCVGATGLLLNSAGAGNGGTYEWSPASNLSSYVVSNPVATPSVSTTYTVTGTDVNGCTNVASVLVNAYPKPMITTANASMCMGGAGAKLSSSGAGIGGVYSWSPSTNLSSANIYNPVAKPSTTTTYTVTGTDANGCTNMATATVTVNPVPIITATGGSFCGNSGKSVMLSSSGAGVGGAYTWNPVLHLSASNIANPIATLTASAVFTVTGTNTFGCSGSATASITVNALPTVSATASAEKLCAGASVTLRGSGAVTYAWDNGAVDGVSFVPNSTKHYKVIGTDVNGCENTASVQVFVNPSPTVAIMAKRTEICMGDSTSLIASGALTYQWDNAVVNGKSFSPTATKTYTVTGTDSNGCKTVNHVLLKVNPLPNITIKTSESEICIGDQVKLNGVGARDYTWNNGISDGVLFNPSATQTYTVIGTDVKGCSSTAQTSVKVNALPNVTANAIDEAICVGSTTALTASGASSYSWDNGITNGQSFTPIATKTYTVTGTDLNSCKNKASITVIVNAKPVVTAAATTTSVCIGKPIALIGGGASTYIWNNGATNAVPFNPTITQTYTVVGTDANGCQNTANINITVHALPVVTAKASKSSICIGETVIVTGGGASSYTWDNGLTDGIAFGPTVSKKYTVIGTDPNNCQNTTSINMVVNQLPTAPQTKDLSICKNDPNPDLAAHVTGSNLRWYDNSNGGTQIQNPTINTVASGTSSIYVSQTDHNSCESPRARITIKVNDYPLAKITTTNLSYCKDQQDGVLLTAEMDVEEVKFEWFKDGISKSAPSTANTYNHALAGIWTVNVKSNISGCVSLSPQVTVIEEVPPIATISTVGPALEYCKNNPLGTYLSATDAGPNTTYEWFRNSVSQSTASANNKNYPDAFAGVWSLKVVNTLSNCPSTSASVTVVEKTAPVSSISNTGNNAAYCVGENGITLSAQPLNGAIYEWFKDGTSAGSGITHTHALAGTWTLKVTVNGCDDTSSAFVVTVKPLPIAEFYTSATSYCANKNGVTLTVKTATVGTTYEWFFNNVSQGTPNTSEVFDNALAGEWKLVTLLDGCTATSSVTKITTDTLPIAQILSNGGALAYCQYTDGVTLQAKDQGVGTQYAWYKDNVLQNTTTSPILAHVTKGNWTMKVNRKCSSETQSITPVIEKSLPYASFTSNSDAYCHGTNGVTLTAKAVSGATYQWKMNGNTIANSSHNNTYFKAMLGTYTVTVSLNGCDSSSSAMQIKEIELPTSNIGGTQFICDKAGESATFEVKLTGTSPWEITYQKPDGATFTSTSTASTYPLIGSTAGVYTILTIKDAHCTGTATGFGRIQNFVSPNIVNTTRTCLPNANAFIVQFSIMNGDPTSYAVTGWNGKLVGNTWTSDTIDEKTTAVLTIGDKHQCNSITQSFSKSCTCPADGMMSGGGEICNDHIATSNIKIDLQGKSPWEIEYTVDGGTPVKVSGIMATPYNFSTSEKSTFTLTKTQDANCKGTANGTASVTYLPAPTAMISGTSSICIGEQKAELQINFTGKAPWSCQVTTPNGNQTLTNMLNNPYLYAPSNEGHYTLASVSDANCAGKLADLKGSGYVQAYVKPDTSSLNVYCDNSDKYYIVVNLTKGDAASYQITGAEGTFNGNVWTSTLINSDVRTTLAIQDHKTCSPLLIDGITKTCICQAKATIAGRKIYCDDSLKASVHISLQGIAPWNIAYRINGGTLVNTTSMVPEMIINHIDKTSGFNLVSVTDSKCIGTTSGEALIVVNRLPTSTITGGGLVCENSPAHMLYMNFTGKPPYNFIYTDGNNLYSNVSNDGLFQIQNPADGDYKITAITDGNGCVANLMRGTTHVQVRKFTRTSLAGDTGICQGTKTPIMVRFDSTSNAPYKLTYDGGNGYEIIDNVTANPYQIMVNPQMTTQVKLIEVTDKYHCTNTKFDDSIHIDVAPIPRLKIINNEMYACSGAQTAIRLISTASGTENSTKFEWTAKFSAKVTGVIAPAVGDAISQTLVNKGTMLEPVTYTITPLIYTTSHKACYGKPDQATIYLRRPTDPTLGNDLNNACVGTKLTLEPGKFIGGNYSWYVNDTLTSNTSDNLNFTVPNGQTNITVSYLDLCGVSHHDTLHIKANEKINIDFVKADTCFGMETQFTPKQINNNIKVDAWSWNFVNSGMTEQTTASDPTVHYSFPSTGKQKVLLEAYHNGCKIGDTTEFVAITHCEFNIVNTFTPNGDGQNDFWGIDGFDRFPNAQIVIMNRWGMIVNQLNGSLLPWNGTNHKGDALEAGVYYYIITLNKVANANETIQGHINILIANNR